MRYSGRFALNNRQFPHAAKFHCPMRLEAPDFASQPVNSTAGNVFARFAHFVASMSQNRPALVASALHIVGAHACKSNVESSNHQALFYHCSHRCWSAGCPLAGVLQAGCAPLFQSHVNRLWNSGCCGHVTRAASNSRPKTEPEDAKSHTAVARKKFMLPMSAALHCSEAAVGVAQHCQHQQ